MTKKDLTKAIAEEMALTQTQVMKIVQRVLDGITQALVREGRIERRPRQARNPRTGEKVDVPEKVVVTFKSGRKMEQRIGQLKNLPNGRQ